MNFKTKDLHSLKPTLSLNLWEFSPKQEISSNSHTSLAFICLTLVQGKSLVRGWSYLLNSLELCSLSNFLFRSIFEHLQGQLEESVEKLSGLLESKNEKPDRTKILNLAANVGKQEANLMASLNDPTFHTAVKQQEDFNKYGSVDSAKYDGWIYTA